MVKLNFGFHKVVGRNRGRISSYQKGGGVKVLYRAVDFFRFMPNVEGRILKIVSDPTRSAFICLVGYTNHIVSYMLLPKGLKVGSKVLNLWSDLPYDSTRVGLSCPLFYVKQGVSVHNVEIKPLKGGKIARSAGTKAVLLKKNKQTGLLRLPSGQMGLISLFNLCTIGEVSNESHKLRDIGKAGLNRRRGIRPHVRGQAMNPVDHPHGGRTNGGKVPCTPWGRVARGVKTSKNKHKKK